MTVPAISVIIPVFNTAPWLRRCLDSVCGQTLQNIEIICINDGSSDESGAILEEYAAKDTRVLPITLGRNQGVGFARNIGLGAARGEWLGFVDSDDSVALDFYEKLYTAAQNNGAEIVKGSCWVERHSAIHLNPNININIEKDKFKFTDFWYTAIYNANFIRQNNIRFPRLTNSQDLVFLYKAVSKTQKIGIVNDALYNYFHRLGSSSTSLRTNKRIGDIISARYAMITILNTNDTLEADKYISEYFRMIQYFYFFFDPGTQFEDKGYASKAISSAIVDILKKCREPDRVLDKMSCFDSNFAALTANQDVEGLALFLSTSILQRFRRKAREHLMKPN